MRKIYLFALLALLLATGCRAAPSTLATQVAQYQNDVGKLAVKWARHIELAKITENDALSPVIAILQEDQQEFMFLAVPEPLKGSRDSVEASMQEIIEILKILKNSKEEIITGYGSPIGVARTRFSYEYNWIMTYQATP